MGKEPRKEKKRGIDIGQSEVNLSPLVLPCSRVPLVQGRVSCLPCDRWTLVGKSCIVQYPFTT